MATLLDFSESPLDETGEGLAINLYSLASAKKKTGASRVLITYLMVDRQIPFSLLGNSKVITDEGLTMLEDALADYKRKAGGVDPCPPRRKTPRKRELASA